MVGAGGYKGISKLMHLVGHIDHTLEEIHLLSLERDFFAAGGGPVAIFQVVVPRNAQARNLAEGAVVVGNQQALVGNHASGAVEAQGDYGVRQAAGLLVVDFTRLEL